MSVVIPLGSSKDQLAALFSYPNIPGKESSLEDTILHWFEQTLARDGFTAQGAKASVVEKGGDYLLVLDGPSSLTPSFEVYGKRLPALLAAGQQVIEKSIPAVKAAGLWDPKGDGWRFFLPLGLPMVRQRSVQLFHYPPMGLLNPLRDYLNDPVPMRWYELLAANGVKSFEEAYLLETIVDGAPVAASDNQGEFISKMLIPTNYFQDYQRSLLPLLLNPAPKGRGYTVPLVVLGAPARAIFTELTGVELGVNHTTTVEIVAGQRTAVIAANHPYAFYAKAQGFDTIGSGKMLPDGYEKSRPFMLADLISARWQSIMVDDPTRDPQAVLDACIQYWNDPAQALAICAMIQHEGSLYYDDGDPARFRFLVSLEQGAALCKGHA